MIDTTHPSHGYVVIGGSMSLVNAREWVVCGRYGGQAPGWFKVTVGWQCFEGQRPYFSITGSWWDNWHWARRNSDTRAGEPSACGVSVLPRKHKIIQGLAVFHMHDNAGTPMHYRRNGEFWLGQDMATNSSVHHLRSHYCWPEVPGTDPVEVLARVKDVAGARGYDTSATQAKWWAEYARPRLPVIQAAMRATLADAGMEWLETPERG